MSTDTPRPERVTLSDEEWALVALIRAHDFSRMECSDHEGHCCPEGGCHDIADHQYDHLANVLAARDRALREEIAQRIEALDGPMTGENSTSDYLALAARIARGEVR